ncbi:MAG: ribose-phosphate diphosphokinase [Ferruginibacter sp.]
MKVEETKIKRKPTMNNLNLIYPERSGIKFKTMVFPDGQPHIKIDVESTDGLNREEPLKVISRISNSNDLVMLLLVKNTLDYLEFQQIELQVAYLMTARMDRVMLDGEPFSLKVIAAILNQANFKKVMIFDPHSEVSTALLDRSYSITNHLFVKDCLDDYFTKNEAASYCLVSPDGGALKKIHKLAQQLNITGVVECMKERDLKTGQLTNFKVFGENLQGKTCFIIDDICDGGGTFIGLAVELKKLGAKKIILVISHGIFSRGFELKNVDEIYTTNSYQELSAPPAHLTIFSISRYLN